MPSEREELIRELKPLLRDIADYGEEYFEKHCEDVAGAILSREKKLLEKIGKPLRDWNNGDTDKEAFEAIDEALAIIEKEGSV